MNTSTNDASNDSKQALVIGANGGIANAIVQQLLPHYQVTGVSRSESSFVHSHYQHRQVVDQTEQQIEEICASFSHPLHLVVCCIGMLHSDTQQVFPEKRLEELSATALQGYFHTNVITPSLWLKSLPKRMARKQRTDVVFISARVGSLNDNRLGGWYGYRASKAALNMLVKTAQVEIKRRLPECILSLYHPGTVNTDLSKPFQSNVASGKLFTPEFTAQQLLSELAKRDVDNAPHYFDWEGKTIPW